MSKILDQLKEAEAKRARVLAERGEPPPRPAREPVDMEAEQRAAARERAVAEMPAAIHQFQEATQRMRARTRAALAIVAALVVAYCLGLITSRQPATPIAVPVFQLDRNVEAFAARLPQEEK